MNWNLQVVEWLAAARVPIGISFFSRFTEFGGVAVAVVVMAIAAFVLWRGKRWAHAVGLLIALAGALATSEVLKFLIQEARPPETLRAIVETGYSFPSNHATAAFALYGFLAWSLWDLKRPMRAIGIAICLLFILLVGFSRIYLGVHYPLDVAGGYAIGAIFLLFGAYATRRLERFED
ncbi:MAG: hypothetical protein RLZZ416_479 [Candidatus Parcubacteria bacterium]|jgi:undecaprenyl-diphosphatase